MSDRRSRTRLVLSDKGDAFNFHIGAVTGFSDPKRLVFDEHGELVAATRRQRLRFWLEDCWLSATRWFRTRTVTAAVDRSKGEVTMVDERWSWRRWRWERTRRHDTNYSSCRHEWVGDMCMLGENGCSCRAEPQ